MYCIYFDEEIWKPIINEPKMGDNKYEVSSHGRVRNIITGHILGLSISNNGYVRVTVNDRRTNKKKNTHLSVHRLVASAFLYNDASSIKCEVNHKDGDKTNNHYENLEWV